LSGVVWLNCKWKAPSAKARGLFSLVVHAGEKNTTSVSARIKLIGRTLLEIHKRAGQIRLGSLVASITLKAVTSLVPLLLVGVSIVGLLAQGNAGLGDQILDNLKISDPSLRKVVNSAIESSTNKAGLVLAISIVTSLYLGLGVISAIASAFDAAWQVPGRGLVDKLYGIPWLISAATVFGLSGYLAATMTRLITVPFFGSFVALLSAAGTGFVAVWISFKLLTNARLPKRAHVPGAVLAGVFLAVFQLIGASLVQRTLAGKQTTYSTFAGIFALFFVFSLFGNILVYGAVANVVIWEHNHGTTQLVGRAPSLPIDMFTELERGGQRPHPSAGSPIGKLLKRLRRT
jgi:membrane protein